MSDRHHDVTPRQLVTGVLGDSYGQLLQTMLDHDVPPHELWPWYEGGSRQGQLADLAQAAIANISSAVDLLPDPTRQALGAQLPWELQDGPALPEALLEQVTQEDDFFTTSEAVL